jgi:WD40 repeat protein
VGKTGKQIFETFEEDNYILSVDYKADGSAFATGGKSNIIKIYDEETKKVTANL